MQTQEVIVIGGGPAGLSAALMLGRCRRRVLLFDADEPRNGAARRLHGYLTRDGVSPDALRRFAHSDVAKYSTVRIRHASVIAATCDATGFRVTTENQQTHFARILLLATGRVDPLPAKAGFARFFGKGVYHCPYCDGYENRNAQLGVYGSSPEAHDLARELLTWAGSVTIYTDGPPHWKPRIPDQRIVVVCDAVRALEGSTRLRRITFETRPPLRCTALFFATECIQRSTLPGMLGCRIDRGNSVICSGFQAKGVKNLFIAGNVRRGVHLAITAAAEGAEAAMSINDALQAEAQEVKPSYASA